MQIPANALLASACLGMLANTGVDGIESRTNLPQRIAWALAAAIFGGWLLFASSQAARPEFYWLKAENALLASRWQEAADYARQGLAVQPSHPRLHRTLGEALMLQGKNARTSDERWNKLLQASSEFSLVVSLAPMDWSNYRLAAEAQLLTRRYQKAAFTVVGAMVLNPTQGSPSGLYARILEVDNQFVEAHQMYLFSSALPGGGPWLEGFTRSGNKMLEQIRASQGGQAP